MATAILIPMTDAEISTAAGLDPTGPYAFYNEDGTAIGGADKGEAMGTASDGLSVHLGNGTQMDVFWADTGAIPEGATITSVELTCSARVFDDGFSPTLASFRIYFQGGWNGSTWTVQTTVNFAENLSSNGNANLIDSLVYSDFTKTLTVDPAIGGAFTRAHLFDSKWGFQSAGFATLESEDQTGEVDSYSATVTYTLPWWKHTKNLTGTKLGLLPPHAAADDTFQFESYLNQVDEPADLDDDAATDDWVAFGNDAPSLSWWNYAAFGWYVYQVATPGTGWVASGAPANDGWYISPEAFGGSVIVVVNARPKDPRSWTDIVAWAAAGTGMLGGSPAASCVFDNHILYPGTDYTVGTAYPPIRVFDGSFDRELCTLPPTTSNTVPQAVLSMLAANGTVYLTSFDSGTSSTDWRGRVMQLDLASGALTVLGTNFAAGEMPYALGWHMGRLWCGTNNGIGTVGKVYYFRPDIDTTWTEDYDVATSTAGAVDSFASYKGKLYVGTDNAAASRGKVLVRSSAGVYTTSQTGTGGTAVVNNGYIALRVFGDNLYASYWNKDTPNISKIEKFNNSSWSTAYTGASTTLRPFILLVEDNDVLFAVGGGCSLDGALVSTPDGTTWTNLTPQLFETSKTLLPVYGVEIL